MPAYRSGLRLAPQRLQRFGGFGPPCSRVGPEADPARAGGDRGKSVREIHAQVPGAVSAHRMAGQVSPSRVGLEEILSLFEHFDGVEASPIFPVEAVRTAIGRRDDMEPRLAGVCLSLADRLDRRAVERKDEPRAALAHLSSTIKRRDMGIILHAAVDRASKGPLVRLARITYSKRNRCGIDRWPGAAGLFACSFLKFQVNGTRPVRSGAGPLISKPTLRTDSGAKVGSVV